MLNDVVRAEIAKVASEQGIEISVLEHFAEFVIANYRKKTPAPKKPKVKKLTLAQVKSAVLAFFEVSDTKTLKKAPRFVMGTNRQNIKLTGKAGWQALYRQFIGILPGEENETGYGCINGINIFNYALPWRAFGLDPKTATTAQVKTAYRNLSSHVDCQPECENIPFNSN
ncbi:MAG: molecular chaperone DnaJ [Acaryochloris sp. RU_4_1]|nr:molecular chaperone DnaJ [Acaryochloris sp. RU_4_1]NJR57089.1 molecular chaperone DnaJ [Acaryochloris sp. CRU_2_0]